MDWKNLYRERTVSAEEAVSRIRSGDRVAVGHACGEPSFLIDAMVANAKAYRDVEIVHMVAMGKCEYAKPELREHFHHNALFVGGGTRKRSPVAMAPIRPASSMRSPSSSPPPFRWMWRW